MPTRPCQASCMPPKSAMVIVRRGRTKQEEMPPFRSRCAKVGFGHFARQQRRMNVNALDPSALVANAALGSAERPAMPPGRGAGPGRVRIGWPGAKAVVVEALRRMVDLHACLGEHPRLGIKPVADVVVAGRGLVHVLPLVLRQFPAIAIERPSRVLIMWQMNLRRMQTPIQEATLDGTMYNALAQVSGKEVWSSRHANHGTSVGRTGSPGIASCSSSRGRRNCALWQRTSASAMRPALLVWPGRRHARPHWTWPRRPDRSVSCAKANLASTPPMPLVDLARPERHALCSGGRRRPMSSIGLCTSGATEIGRIAAPIEPCVQPVQRRVGLELRTPLVQGRNLPRPRSGSVQRQAQRLHDVSTETASINMHPAARTQGGFSSKRNGFSVVANPTKHDACRRSSVRQERILLDLVEAMDLIHEQHAVRPHLVQTLRGLGSTGATSGRPAQYLPNTAAESASAYPGQQQRQRGLAAGLGGPPQAAIEWTRPDSTARRNAERGGQQAAVARPIIIER
ncbi:hypothetical protein FQR65_LT20663 [Abscondita terminalis]|nr:hypothetical protein FQR65_LT20663 [Abscondita terminalis]